MNSALPVGGPGRARSGEGSDCEECANMISFNQHGVIKEHFLGTLLQASPIRSDRKSVNKQEVLPIGVNILSGLFGVEIWLLTLEISQPFQHLPTSSVWTSALNGSASGDPQRRQSEPPRRGRLSWCERSIFFFFFGGTGEKKAKEKSRVTWGQWFL